MTFRTTLRALVPALALLVPTGVLAPSAEAATSTTLSLANSIYQPVSYGSTGQYKARLRTASGRALGNRPVTLWARPVGTTTWSRVASTRTMSTGLGIFRLSSLKQNVHLQARFSGTSTLAPVRSKLLLQKVFAPLTGFSAPSGTFVGDTPVARATTAASLSGGTAVVEAYRSGSWVEKGRATIGSGGAIEVPFTPEAPRYDAERDDYAPAPYQLRTLDGVLSSAARSFSVTTSNFGLGSHVVNADKGVPVSYQVEVQGGEGPFTFMTISGQLPPGVTLGSGGLVSGTPTSKGSFVSTMQVTDATGRQATGELRLNVLGDAITVTNESFPTATVGSYYEASIDAVGGVGPYEFDVEGLPSSLTLYADGTIAGTPDEAGTFTVRVHVFDQDFNATTKDVPLTIVGG